MDASIVMGSQRQSHEGKEPAHCVFRWREKGDREKRASTCLSIGGELGDCDGFFFRLASESRVQVVDAGPGEDSTGDGEPGGEDRARYDGCRHGSEVDLGKTGGEAGILHADFDGEGDGFLPGEAAELGYGKT